MRFVIGLGNPGAEYTTTRHNVGWLVLDELANRLSAAGNNVQFQSMPKVFAEVAKVGTTMLVKPQTYMNDSGRAVRAILEYYKQDTTKLDQVFVVHDDLDLELGNVKFQFGTGPKVHNGLGSINQHLGSEQYWHVRVGVDGRQGDRSMPGREYVLQPFSAADMARLTPAITAIVDRLLKEING